MTTPPTKVERRSRQGRPQIPPKQDRGGRHGGELFVSDIDGGDLGGVSCDCGVEGVVASDHLGQFVGHGRREVIVFSTVVREVVELPGLEAFFPGDFPVAEP